MMQKEPAPTLMVVNLDAAFSTNNIVVSFSQCTVDVVVLKPLNVEGGDERIMDLAFLNSLKVEDDFLPSSLYVRDCMRNAFELFRKDTLVTATNNHRRVLLGSPGDRKHARIESRGVLFTRELFY
jgi:hypothetical protein